MQGYKIVFLSAVSLAVLGIACPQACPAQGKVNDAAYLKAQVRLLTSQVKRLNSDLDKANERIDQLEKEIAGLRALVAKAAEDAESRQTASKEGQEDRETSPETQPRTDDEEKPRPARKDPNAKIIEAIKEYKAAVDKIDETEVTTVKKKQEWFNAARKLNAALRRNRVAISYKITDVESNEGYAEISVDKAAIVSSDPRVPEAKLDYIYDKKFEIVATAQEAAKIAMDSKLLVRGLLATNIDFSKPLRDQPSFYSMSSRGRNAMEGYRRVGRIKDLTTPKSISGTIYLMLKHPLVEIDGRIKKLRER